MSKCIKSTVSSVIEVRKNLPKMDPYVSYDHWLFCLHKAKPTLSVYCCIMLRPSENGTFW